MRGVMDALNEEGVETVVVMSSAQVGKTEAINNVVGFHVHHDPAPILVLQPTIELGRPGRRTVSPRCCGTRRPSRARFKTRAPGTPGTR